MTGEQMSRWVMQAAYLASGFIYIHSIERRPGSRKKTAAMILVFLIYFASLNRVYVYVDDRLELATRMIGFLLLGLMNYVGRKVSWYAAFLLCGMGILLLAADV